MASVRQLSPEHIAVLVLTAAAVVVAVWAPRWLPARALAVAIGAARAPRRP